MRPMAKGDDDVASAAGGEIGRAGAVVMMVVLKVFGSIIRVSCQLAFNLLNSIR